jgi:hypothetical protein
MLTSLQIIVNLERVQIVKVDFVNPRTVLTKEKKRKQIFSLFSSKSVLPQKELPSRVT